MHTGAKKQHFVHAVLQLTVQRRGDRFEMVTLAGDIRLLQDHHLTPGQEGGKDKDDKKTEIND